MTLFDSHIRELDGPADYTTNAYYYFNNSTRPEVINVCNQLEEWFMDFPEDEKADLKQRFTVSYFPCFYELYIFGLFTRLGYKLDVHPIIEGTTKRPDYKATKADGTFFYIEVKCVTLKNAQESNLENRTNVLLDAMNKIDSSNFLLKLDKIEFKSGSQPSGKLVVQYYNKLIAGINPEVYEEELLIVGYEKMPKLIYNDDKVRIELQLFPKAPQFRGASQSGRSIGTHPVVTQIGNDSDSLISGLGKKSSRYGHLNAPYLICINKQTVAFDIIELQEALYGSLAITYSTDPNNPNERHEWMGNGFFGNKNNPQHTRVSAVYLTNANEANLTRTADHALRHNPYAVFPIDIKIDRSIQEIFNLPEIYPY